VSTSEQEIPESFVEQAKQAAEYLRYEEYKVPFRSGAEWAYRHLKSLPDQGEQQKGLPDSFWEALEIEIEKEKINCPSLAIATYQMGAMAAYRILSSPPQETGLGELAERLKEMSNEAFKMQQSAQDGRYHAGLAHAYSQAARMVSASSPADKPEAEPMTVADQLLEEILACTNGFKDSSWEASIKKRIEKYFQTQKTNI
jgi:hypothetical protein